MVVGRLVEQDDPALEFAGKDGEEFLPAGYGLLEVALQDPGHDEDRVGVSQEVPAVEVQAAAPRQDAGGQRRGDVSADPLIAGARGPDFVPRLAPRAPQRRRRRRRAAGPSATQRSRDQVVMGCPTRIGDTRHFTGPTVATKSSNAGRSGQTM